MRIAILSAGSSIHTRRWLEALAPRHQLLLLTLHPATEPLPAGVEAIKLPIPAPLGYYLNAPWLRRVLKQWRPDLLHAHYASGYGTLARLGGFHPCLLSVWGSDIYDFPQQSAGKARLIAQNLAFADQILATGEALKRETLRYVQPQQEIVLTPFGVDTDDFSPALAQINPDSTLVFGTVKTLAPIYGIDRLLQAFALALKQGLPPQTRLKIAGGGPQRAELESLSHELNLAEHVDWLGPVPHKQVPQILQQLDVYLALSRQESFGVAVLEASACGIPVIVSDAGGLPEVVSDGETGYIVPDGNPEGVAQHLLTLAADAGLRQRLGQQGRAWVEARYSWPLCVAQMESVYTRLAGLNK